MQERRKFGGGGAGRQSLILYDTCESELLMQHGSMGIFEPTGRVKMQNTGSVYKRNHHG